MASEAMMSQCDSDSTGDDVMQWILELFISFGSFFLLLTQPMKSTLPLFLSLCQSVCLSLLFVSCLRLPWFHCLTFSDTCKHNYTLNTRGASRRHPAVTDQIKTGAQTYRFILSNAITCTQTLRNNVFYLHTRWHVTL